MKPYTLTISLFFISLTCFSQVDLVLDALETDFYDVPREEPTDLTIRRSSFISDAASGFILLAGDGGNITATQNNLDCAKIIGNKFVSTTGGTDRNAMLLGNNINYIVQHNYFDRVGYSSSYRNGGVLPMEWTAGAHAYNIHKNTKALLIKGMSGLRVYNNTFFAKENGSLYHIRIEKNRNSDIDVPATNTKIKNNIFYQEINIPAIFIEQESCLAGLECDYNVYYAEDKVDKKPYFDIGENRYTWDEWRALGYDTHSIIMDPKFIDTESFVPSERLNFGLDLGSDHAIGLATTAKWELGKYPDTVEQNGEWQVGAVLYGVNTSIKNLDSSTNSSDGSDLIITYPNPSTGIFMVELPKDMAEVANTISVVSMTGKIIYNGTIPMGEYSMKIDLSNVSPGFYIISCVNSNFSKKIRIH